MKRVLIADDDFLVRTYLKQMISWEEQGFYIIGDAKNGREALEILQRDGADILIADVSMPIMDGIELTRQVKKFSPSTHILILS
ncbi:MAG: response regulator, partial [Selenomonadaceae bacterium]|nr:response regulator [Selenomonadaceae bacterium]